MPRNPLLAPRFVAQMMANRHLTQVELAARIGISQGHVSHVLAGNKGIDFADVDAWADALDLTPDQRELFDTYVIRSYGPECTNRREDAIERAQASLAALERTAETQRTTIDVLRRHVEALERENAELRERDARRPSAG